MKGPFIYLIHSFIHSFIHSIFIERLLCDRHCTGDWRLRGKPVILLCDLVAHSLLQKRQRCGPVDAADGLNNCLRLGSLEAESETGTGTYNCLKEEPVQGSGTRAQWGEGQSQDVIREHPAST